MYNPFMCFTKISVKLYILYCKDFIIEFNFFFKKQVHESTSEGCLDVNNAIDNSRPAAANLELTEQIDNFKHQNNLLNSRSKILNNDHTCLLNSNFKLQASYYVFLLIIVHELELENRKLRAEASAPMSLPPPPPPLPPPSFNPIK